MLLGFCCCCCLLFWGGYPPDILHIKCDINANGELQFYLWFGDSYSPLIRSSRFTGRYDYIKNQLSNQPSSWPLL